jgi:hypothetical protein
MWHVVSGLTLACITVQKLAALVVVDAGRRCDVRVLQAATTFLFLSTYIRTCTYMASRMQVYLTPAWRDALRYTTLVMVFVKIS